MKGNNVIELKNVSKHYHMGDSIVKAIDGVDIAIERGDFVAIMGPSGSGKSTGMNLTGSLDLATNGEIFLDGKDIEHLEESELAQIRGKKIGFIFQQFNLIPTLTAKGNVMLPMLFQGMEKEAREERAEKLLEMIGLKDRMEHYPNQLSGGQQQRVAIARALVNEAPIILADEPTGNLDTKTSTEIMELFVRLYAESDITVILVTHEHDIAAYSKRTMKFLDGRVVSDGPTINL